MSVRAGGLAGGGLHQPQRARIPPALGRVADYYARPSSFTTGGVNGVRLAWSTALASRAESVTLLEAAGGLRARVPPGSPLLSRALAHRGRSRMTMVPTRFSAALEEVDLLLLHEGWTVSNLVAARAARRAGVPYVVITHGVYDPHITGTLTLARTRARAERWLLHGAHAVHVYFDAEIAHVHAVAPRARCIVTPLGSASPAQPPSAPVTATAPGTATAPVTATTALPAPEGPCWTGAGTYVAWLGRYDIHHKGLDLLVAAVAALPPAKRPLIRLHGPDHLGDRERLAALVASSGLGAWIDVGGELHGPERQHFYAHASAVVHPARWESFGLSVVEALLMGVPVILSDTTQLARPLRAAAAAIVTATDPGALGAAFAVLSDRRLLAETGARGRAWAQSELGQELALDRFLAQLPTDRPLRRTPKEPG